MSRIRIVIAQLNFPVGAIAANTRKIIATIKEAREQLNADIVLFPELALCGYPPEDLLLRSDFQQQIVQALQEIKANTHAITVILGYPEYADNQCYNAACIMRDEKIILNYRKQHLPNYGVFDEKRYFNAGTLPAIFTYNALKFGLLICEDLWQEQPATTLAEAGAQCIIVINASPFDHQKAEQREQLVHNRSNKTKLPFIYAHRVSAQDDLIFDGGSFAMNAQQQICAQAQFFSEELLTLEIDAKTCQPVQQILPVKPSITAKIYQALVLGVREYVDRNKFPGVLIGLSGGIDSALVLAIAVDALGKQRVHTVSMPSQYTSQLSLELVAEISKNFGIASLTIPIDNDYDRFISALTPICAQPLQDITHQNLQARCRGILLMGLSNQTGNLVLSTSNKSEMAVGYSTLYGDMVGGFAVLKDVYKTLVYQLANYRNKINPQIPAAIITRAPTAELAYNQTDQDSLPPYEILDQILELVIEQKFSASAIIERGFAQDTVTKVIKMVINSEYKRRQAPPGPRVTPCAFGRERRYPITTEFNFLI